MMWHQITSMLAKASESAVRKVRGCLLVFFACRDLLFLKLISKISEAVRALQSAIEIMTKRGRFYVAAGHQKTVAEIYESDMVNIKASMEAYEIAADWYFAEDATR